MTTMPPPHASNLAHALDGGILRLFHSQRHWPAASDERRCQQSLRRRGIFW